MQAWLYRVALNVFRNRARRPRLPEIDLEHASAASDHNQLEPSVSAEHRETQGELAALLLELPRHYREAVVLRYVEELSYIEIGSVLGKPEGTVKSDVHRGIGMLRTMMATSAQEVFA